MKEPDFIYTRDLCDRYTFSCVNFAARSGRRSALALILSSLLAGTGPAWAVCTTSGGVQTDSGTLAPNSGETVDCLVHTWKTPVGSPTLYPLEEP